MTPTFMAESKEELKRLLMKVKEESRKVGLKLNIQRVKHLPAMRETWVWSLGWEDPLEKEMATHSSILAWRIPWTEEPGRLQSTGSQRVGHGWVTSLSFSSFFTSVWDECNCAVVWAFFGIAFLWDWNENWPFPVLWPLLSFPNLLTYWVGRADSFEKILMLAKTEGRRRRGWQRMR